MKVKKKNLTEALKIIESFTFKKNQYGKDNKTNIPKYILRYTEARLNEADTYTKGLLEYKTEDATFYLEYFEGNFYLTRKLPDGRETKLLLSDKDIDMIKDASNITKKDLAKLVNKIEVKEKRFGL